MTNIASMLFLPLVFYFVCFVALTFPLILRFRTHYFGDEWDAAQNLWNMWWVNKAVTELHQPIWYTRFIHYPHGTTLLGHTLSPFNGFIGILLQKFLTLPESYNVMVIFGFVVGGWTAFLLAYIFSRSYWGSILGGYIFAFSSYHFAHARGHLQLVSLEWIPLFIGTFFLFLKRPTVPRAIASASSLFLVALCDYYYALYCILTGCILLIHRMWFNRDRVFMLRKKYLRATVAFCCVFIVTTGALFGFFVLEHVRDPFTEGRAASLDLLSLFVYGGQWRFRWLTEPIWSRIPPNPTESNVHLGFSVIFVLIYAWAKRKDIVCEYLRLWYVILLFFTICAMGPTLNICGTQFSSTILPWRIVEMFPFAKLVGCPVRMMVMTFLSAGVIVAMASRRLFTTLLNQKIFGCLFVALLVFEYLPCALPSMPVHTPKYVRVIKGLPTGGIVDRLNDKFAAHYYQTLYERPRAVGLISRYPKSVEEKYTEFDEVLMEDIPQYSRKLYDDYKLRYILAKQDYPPNPKLKLLYSDTECRIYELQP